LQREQAGTALKPKLTEKSRITILAKMELGPSPSKPQVFAQVELHLAGNDRCQASTGTRQGRRRARITTGITRIFIFGRMRELALYRAEVLKSRGFSVVVPASKTEALDAIEQGEFDVAVLSYTLSSDTIQELSELLRQKCPTCPLITISENHSMDPKVRPDRIVLAHQGPEALIKALRQVIKPQ
jgi:CheY-like chemotaxis protein